MRRFFNIAVIILFLSLLPTSLQASGWQSSMAQETELGVRNAYGTKPYDAVFEVYSPFGKVFRKRIRVAEGDAWGFVRFPSDFGTEAKYAAGPHNFKWVCKVRGQVVVSGEFGYKY